ncbi:MAG TPA: TatD family hydrolase [Pseudonocardiaceae bacterium]|nr:TatD family hydrolase [Pseudonocardiaceae bacterium]
MSKRNGELPPVPDPLPVPVVDAHTHLEACGATDAPGVRAMVDRAAAAGIDRVVTVADDLASARWVVDASTWDERVFAAVAVHPTRTAQLTDDDRKVIAELAARPRVVAVGETGLDYYWDYSPPAAQQAAFRWHIRLAKELHKPLMIHDRDAHDDVLSILDDEGPPDTVVFHSYSGDVAMTERCVAAGYILSFSGTVTFRNAPVLQESATLVPDGQLLVETDAPFLTPHPFRGRPNEPYCTAYTVRAMARLRGVSDAELGTTLRNNAERVFGLDRLA